MSVLRSNAALLARSNVPAEIVVTPENVLDPASVKMLVLPALTRFPTPLIAPE
jgi:hypothetical protein